MSLSNTADRQNTPRGHRSKERPQQRNGEHAALRVGCRASERAFPLLIASEMRGTASGVLSCVLSACVP